MLYRDKKLIRDNLTIKKAINIVFMELQRVLKLKTIIYHPYFATIDPCNSCNLKCVLCSAGGNFDPTISRGKMNIDMFQQIINNYGDYLIMINLFTFGEPLLNRDIFKMIKIAEDKGIGVRISTNFQHFNEQMAIDMVTSGLQYLTISLDGSTQEIYEQYRVGGSLQKILGHTLMLQAKKTELNSKTPEIEFQTLIFRHNQNDVDNVSRLAKTYNVHHEVLAASPLASNRVDFLPNNDNINKPVFRNISPCQWLYRWIVVNWNGNIHPCCNANGIANTENLNKEKLRSRTIDPCKSCIY